MTRCLSSLCHISSYPCYEYLYVNSNNTLNNNTQSLDSKHKLHFTYPQNYKSHNVNSTQKALFSSNNNNPQHLPRTTNNDNDPSSTTTTSSDGLIAATPINFDIASNISGNESQILTINLYPNQILRAESGAMMYMTEGITMNTTTGGGMSQSFKRYLTGQNLFISDYTFTRGGGDGSGDGGDGEGSALFGTVCLGTDFPSKILRLNVDEYGGKIICQKGALLCSSHTIDIEMEFTKKFSTGFFGGEGFVLQGLIGKGDVFVKAGG